jgi:hypothetical protein
MKLYTGNTPYLTGLNPKDNTTRLYNVALSTPLLPRVPKQFVICEILRLAPNSTVILNKKRPD